MREDSHSYVRKVLMATVVAMLLCHCPSPAYAEESPAVPSDTPENFVINDDSSSGGMDGLPVPALYAWLGLSGLALVASVVSIARDCHESRTERHNSEEEAGGEGTEALSAEPPAK